MLYPFVHRCIFMCLALPLLNTSKCPFVSIDISCLSLCLRMVVCPYAFAWLFLLVSFLFPPTGASLHVLDHLGRSPWSLALTQKCVGDVDYAHVFAHAPPAGAHVAISGVQCLALL